MCKKNYSRASGISQLHFFCWLPPKISSKSLLVKIETIYSCHFAKPSDIHEIFNKPPIWISLQHLFEKLLIKSIVALNMVAALKDGPLKTCMRWEHIMLSAFYACKSAGSCLSMIMCCKRQRWQGHHCAGATSKHLAVPFKVTTLFPLGCSI